MYQQQIPWRALCVSLHRNADAIRLKRREKVVVGRLVEREDSWWLRLHSHENSAVCCLHNGVHDPNKTKTPSRFTSVAENFPPSWSSANVHPYPSSLPWSRICSSLVSIETIGVVRLGPPIVFFAKSIRRNAGAPISWSGLPVSYPFPFRVLFVPLLLHNSERRECPRLLVGISEFPARESRSPLNFPHKVE
jgi:hypothetical protein